MMKCKALNKLAVAGAAVIALSSAVSVSAADLRLKFAGTLPVDHPGTQMMKQIEKEIEAADVGLKVSVFPANQLGSGEELFEDSIRGNIDMVSGFIYSHKDPVLEINSLPYLTSSWEEMDSVVRNKESAYNQIMRERLDKLGIRLMESIPEGFTGIVATKKPNDWAGTGDKGMNIRVWSSNVAKSLVELMGYNTTTMAWGDMFPALQSGIVDGAICCTSQSAYTIFAVSDVGKYFIANDAIIEIFFYYISEKTWAKMNQAQRDVVTAAFSKAAGELFELNKTNDQVYRDKLVAKGYEVLEPTAEQKQALKALVQAQVWPQLEPTVGKDVMDRIKADAQ
ncbi:MAG: TRAP transporter substrate-binding protein DctP [Pseudomonadales bacterium]